jgi:copper oxidase (laccase) domain-containing protein
MRTYSVLHPKPQEEMEATMLGNRQNPMEPTAIFTPFDGRVEIRLFGRNGIGVDWSISKVNRQEDLESPEALEQFAQLRHVALQAGVETVYAPNITVNNTRLCQPEDFADRIILANSSFTLVRGAPVNGCSIPRGCGAWFSTADCHVVVACNVMPGVITAAHADRDSLFNRAKIVGDCDFVDQPDSIVDSIASTLSTEWPSTIKVFVAGGIGPRHFTHPPSHPEYGVANRAMLAHFDYTCGRLALDCSAPSQGCLWIPEIIRQQFVRHGVEPHNIATDGGDTYDSWDAETGYAWWSHRRAVKRGRHDGRNGVLVIRRW